MLKFIIAAVALLAVAGGLTYWAYDRGGDSAEAEVQVVRWFNVTVVIPEGSGLVSDGTYGIDDRPVLGIRLVKDTGDTGYGVAIDARTGAVLSDRVAPEYRDLFDAVLQSVIVSPLDPITAPWPYTDLAPGVARLRFGDFSFIPPDPASGIIWGLVTGGTTEGLVSTSITFTNGRSTIGVNIETGAAGWQTAKVMPEDQEAFDRLLSAVELAEPSGTFRLPLTSQG